MAKKGLHPEWHDEAKVFCNGEEVLVTSGTKGSYTGAQGAPDWLARADSCAQPPRAGGPPRHGPAAALRRAYVPCPTHHRARVTPSCPQWISGRATTPTTRAPPPRW